jgi:hypothetical protein
MNISRAEMHFGTMRACAARQHECLSGVATTLHAPLIDPLHHQPQSAQQNNSIVLFYFSLCNQYFIVLYNIFLFYFIFILFLQVQQVPTWL